MGISPLWDFHWYFQRYTLYTFPIGPLVGVFVWKSNSIFINPISRLERQHSTFNSAIKFNLFVHPWTLPNNILGMPNFGVYCIFYWNVFFSSKKSGGYAVLPQPQTLYPLLPNFRRTLNEECHRVGTTSGLEMWNKIIWKRIDGRHWSWVLGWSGVRVWKGIDERNRR